MKDTAERKAAVSGDEEVSGGQPGVASSTAIVSRSIVRRRRRSDKHADRKQVHCGSVLSLLGADVRSPVSVCARRYLSDLAVRLSVLHHALISP